LGGDFAGFEIMGTYEGAANANAKTGNIRVDGIAGDIILAVTGDTDVSDFYELMGTMTVVNTSSGNISGSGSFTQGTGTNSTFSMRVTGLDLDADIDIVWTGLTASGAGDITLTSYRMALISAFGSEPASFWPLLAPDGDLPAASYSFLSGIEKGMFADWLFAPSVHIQNKDDQPDQAGRSSLNLMEEVISLSTHRTEDATHVGTFQCQDFASTTMECQVIAVDAAGTAVLSYSNDGLASTGVGDGGTATMDFALGYADSNLQYDWTDGTDVFELASDFSGDKEKAFYVHADIGVRHWELVFDNDGGHAQFGISTDAGDASLFKADYLATAVRYTADTGESGNLNINDGGPAITSNNGAGEVSTTDFNFTNTTFSDPVLLPDGTSAAKGLAFSANPDAGLFHSSLQMNLETADVASDFSAYVRLDGDSGITHPAVDIGAKDLTDEAKIRLDAWNKTGTVTMTDGAATSTTTFSTTATTYSDPILIPNGTGAAVGLGFSTNPETGIWGNGAARQIHFQNSNDADNTASLTLGVGDQINMVATLEGDNQVSAYLEASKWSTTDMKWLMVSDNQNTSDHVFLDINAAVQAAEISASDGSNTSNTTFGASETTFTDPIIIPDGSITAPAIAFASDPNLGISYTASSFQISGDDAVGTTRFRLTPGINPIIDIRAIDGTTEAAFHLQENQTTLSVDAPGPSANSLVMDQTDLTIIISNPGGASTTVFGNTETIFSTVVEFTDGSPSQPGVTDGSGNGLYWQGTNETGLSAAGNEKVLIGNAFIRLSNTLLDPRQYIKLTPTTLTSDTATGIFTIGVAADSVTGFTVNWSVTADDGTDFQLRRGTTYVAAVNKATVESCDTTVGQGAYAESAGGSTLVVVPTCIDGGTNLVEFELEATSSLTETTLEVLWTVEKDGLGQLDVLP
jgi:hypothetical protein